MTRLRIPLGLLFSQSGDYARLSREARDGALAAVAQVNGDPQSGVGFEVFEADPEGRTDRYAPLCGELLRGSVRHVVGCITSWSRKEIIPVLERHDAMLWYAPPYEGFEAHERIVYLGACPNQHVVPLLAYAIPRFGNDAYLVGSNYIWGWEVNRIAREIVGDAGGRTLGERYLPLGDTDVARIVEEIRVLRPAFVVNNLIGPSSYAFLDSYHRLGRADPDFAPARRPVLSCNLVEDELAALQGAGDGVLTVGPYFRGDDPAPASPRSAFMASAASAVLVLAAMARVAGTGEPEAISASFAGRRFATPLGEVAVDPQTHHLDLPVLIGRASGSRFEPVWRSPAPVAPDPYLSRYDPRDAFRRPALRIVP
ncbi:transporter substrate-binding protein [Aureimonas sp. AU4]|uniref:transporter substrate-binding protein n=1 Tax=Aureimonas sp. AU4 TaxID=1638163 RepID=UPI0007846A1D|nr:transporter substrate-binding protein [Aureimonas sp. AU4]